jgi:hypothetical protein
MVELSKVRIALKSRVLQPLRLGVAVTLGIGLLGCADDTRFEQLSASQTGIHFSNRILENDTMNILAYEYVYNGGGVAVGDFNNDSLPDLYFTANMGKNRLYLNKGDFRFEDVTDAAGVSGEGKWSSGVAVVDINNDGLLDLYVCATAHKSAARRANMLYVNQGINEQGAPAFKEMAADYGLADTTHTTMATFFDYDNDGDLDLFLLVNEMDEKALPNSYKAKITDGSSPRTDRLYRNDWDPVRKQAFFTNVSAQVGILKEGYGLGINITDINQDGWKDIYITNDYLSNDLLYVNNGDGTFTDRADQYFKRTSHSAMGNDVVDLNNDGLPDVVAVDMMPATNYRKKMMTPANNYVTYQNNDLFGYQYQSPRNTFQLNRGLNPETRQPVFSEIGLLAGMAETDWSWTPLVADFDNDGFRDLIITNGFPRDVTDLDFIAYRAEVANLLSRMELREYIPSVKIRNFAFRNTGNLQFEDVTDQWGIKQPSFSNGGVYVDLDKDGNLDYVVNNINDSASVFRNKTPITPQTNYLRVSFRGDSLNRLGLGAILTLTLDSGRQLYYEHTPYRGYLSSVDLTAHFGLGATKKVSNLSVTWPNGKSQVLSDVSANQTLQLDIRSARLTEQSKTHGAEELPFFRQVASLKGLDFVHREQDIIDFNLQKLLPHKLSQYGPALAVGDINGDGLQDFYVGGSYQYKGRFFIQKPDGTFKAHDGLPGTDGPTKIEEDMGSLLFDADGDDDLDLYVVSGSYEFRPNTPSLQDRLYLNDGKGRFTLDTQALPRWLSSGSCVKAADFDGDGDLDLFVGGRVEQGAYPKPVSSYLLRNDSQKGRAKFTDVTARLAPDLLNIGLVTDALWTDHDNDGQPDLLIAGEWMPLTFLKNTKGQFRKTDCGLGQYVGWWNSLAAGDFDNDGDMDYIAGNLGLNTFNRASEQQPIGIYAKDFNDDGYFDAIPTVYFRAEDGKMSEFPYNTRDDMAKQMIQAKQRFPEHSRFATSSIKDILLPEELNGALVLRANWMQTSLIENVGNGTFTVRALPLLAQVAPVFGMIVQDINQDGFLDMLLNGNDYGAEVAVGRYDASYGLLLLGDGKGGFTPVNMPRSGYCTLGDTKAMVKIPDSAGKMLVLTSQNRGPLHLAEQVSSTRGLPLLPNEVSAIIKLKNGRSRREEIGYGNSFLSQSARYIWFDSYTTAVEVLDARGKKTRTITP